MVSSAVSSANADTAPAGRNVSIILNASKRLMSRFFIKILLCQSSILPVSPQKAPRQKEKSAAPAKWLVQRFAFCTLGGACPLYLCFSLPLLKGKAIVVPRKATPINFSITPHQLPFGGTGTFPHSRRGLRRGLHRAKCSWRPILGLPPCVTAFRLIC